MMTIVALALVAALAAGQPVEMETQIRTIALFKNGLGYFVRTGQLPEAPAEIEVGPMPAASHGTFWLGWGDQVQFANLRSVETQAAGTRDALVLEDLLRANVGKRAKIWLTGDEGEMITGRIIACPRPPRPDPPNPYVSIVPPPDGPRNANLLVIESDGAKVAVWLNTVRRVEFLDEPEMEIPVDERAITLSGRLVRGGGPLSISYLAKGITWAPSYQVDISDDENARLTAKATIINEIEDLEDVQIDLVTGYPYLEFAQIISPLAQKEDLASFLNALYRGESERRWLESGPMAQVALKASWGMPGVPTPDYGAPAQGVSAEDLFFYPVENVTLAEGETGYYPLFSATVPYEHVYTWDVPDYIDDQDHYAQPPEEQRQIVWHSLRLSNEMGMPWTTAPAETVKGGRILGQSTLHYTPPGGKTLVKITHALGIQAEEIELEIARQPNAANFHGYRYDRVTVKGTLTMRSHMDRSVDVKVTKMLTGEVQESSPEAEVQQLAAGLKRVNPRSRLTWERPLAAGEEIEMAYVYEVYIRN